MLFDQIMKEIEERKSFLEEMRAIGKLNDAMAAQVRAEISQRVAELKRLNQRLGMDSRGEE